MASKIGISESALYRKLKGDSKFSCREIKFIIQILELPEPLWIEIFLSKAPHVVKSIDTTAIYKQYETYLNQNVINGAIDMKNRGRHEKADNKGTLTRVAVYGRTFSMR